MQKASEYYQQLIGLRFDEAEAMRITRSKIGKDLTDDLAPAPAVTLKEFDDLLQTITRDRTALEKREEQAPVQRSASQGAAAAKDDFFDFAGLYADLELHIERSGKRTDTLAQAQGTSLQILERLTHAVVKLSDQIAAIGQRSDGQFVEIQRSLASRVPAGPRALTGAQPLGSPNEEAPSKQDVRVQVTTALKLAIARSAQAVQSAATPAERAVAQAEMDRLRTASSQLSGGADPAQVAATAGLTLVAKVA